MPRHCFDCNDYLYKREFSFNQWRKGPGSSRCKSCVGEGYTAPYYQCQECYRDFNNQNELNMHMQVHRPRGVSCPVCSETRFRSGANAVQHVESGYCSGCAGADNARDQIYRLALGKRSMKQYILNRPLLTNGGSHGSTPDYPYYCPACTKPFRQLSQLLQHNDQKHNNMLLLSY